MDIKEICLDNTVIGCAEVTVEGLYATIKCSCRFPKEKIYTVYLKNSREERLLGTCVPKKGSFTLETKIPKKYISESNAMLYATEKYAEKAKDTIILAPGEPVDSVALLEQTVYQVKAGKACLILK